jgi:hypothetical protein
MTRSSLEDPVTVQAARPSPAQERGLAIYGLAVLAKCSPTTIGALESWDYKPTLPVHTQHAPALDVAEADIWPEGAPEMAA